MRFLFVSKIHEMTDRHIRGEVRFGESEPWRFAKGSSETVSISVVSEAVGQLASWLSLKNTNFSGRPVFLFASRIDLSAGVPLNSVVQLSAEITDESADSFLFSGEAKLGEQTVVKINDCGGYLMPLADLEDPHVTKARFETLISNGFEANPGSSRFSYESLIDTIKDHVAGRQVIAKKRFLGSEPFYPDHFPRFPVTPIVVINEMIAQATRSMMSVSGRASDVGLVPVSVRDLKIKSFIRPGDSVEIVIKHSESMMPEFETVAEVVLDGKRILRGRYRYRLDQ